MPLGIAAGYDGDPISSPSSEQGDVLALYHLNKLLFKCSRQSHLLGQ